MPNLTPLSHSLLSGALRSAQQRYTQALGLSAPTLLRPPAVSGDPLGDAWLAVLVCLTWDQSGERSAHLLGLSQSPTARGGKPAKAAKAAEALIVEAAENGRRLAQWCERVAGMSWSQAQLLQVMEEIEPKLVSALHDERRLAANAVGAYAHLLDLLDRSAGTNASGRVLALTAGLESPDAAMISDLANGMEPAAWLQRYGHRGENELELALPRLHESPPPLLASPSAATRTRWNPQTASQQRQQAEQAVMAQAGFLQRSALRHHIELVQTLLVTHAQARDTLARVLAAIRRWTLAAAAEGLRDGRLVAQEEIFFWSSRRSSR